MENADFDPENEGASDGATNISPEDSALAAKALRKLSAGEKPFRDEMGALKRVRKQQQRHQRQTAYRCCPQNEYAAMCGRTRQALKDAQRVYGLPCGGREVNGVGGVVDLAAVIRWLHDFLAKNAPQMAADKRDGSDPGTRKQIQNLQLRVKQLELGELEKELVRFDVIEEAVLELFARLKTAHDLLRQTVPADAMLVVVDAMAQIELYWRRKFGDETAAAEQRRHEQAVSDWSI